MNFGRCEPTTDPCTLVVDGVVNASRVGVGVVLISPNEQYTETQSIKLEFTLSNNQTEYEALLIGIEFTHELNIITLNVYSNSHSGNSSPGYLCSIFWKCSVVCK